MKLRDYRKNLNDFIRNNPGALDLEVVSSSDQEGNNFFLVVYAPSKGRFDEGNFDTSKTTGKEPNAVCVT